MRQRQYLKKATYWRMNDIIFLCEIRRKICSTVPWQRRSQLTAVTRIRTWVVAATTRSTNHYTITAITAETIDKVDLKNISKYIISANIKSTFFFFVKSIKSVKRWIAGKAQSVNVIRNKLLFGQNMHCALVKKGFASWLMFHLIISVETPNHCGDI